MRQIKKKVYLDYAATTPIDPRALKAMLPYLKDDFGNTMSLHSFGQKVKVTLEKSRERVADLIGAEPNEIIFTSSATESNNLVIKGVAFANKTKGKHIVISQIEHPCILESSKWLEKQGFKVTRISVDENGLISPNEVKKAIQKDTILVSIIHANNEIGTIQPIKAIGKICKERGVYFHTDAAQSMGKIPIDVKKMNIDFLTGSSHKMYGPKGAACLYIKKGVIIEPLLHGGGHENGLRASTHNIASIVGFAKACEICSQKMKEEAEKQTKMRDKIIKEILKKIDNAYLNGHPQKRLPNNINFRFDFVEGESIVMMLDLEGIAASTGSACSSEKLEPSHVLLAIGLKPQQAHGSLRISFGRFTKKEDIDYLMRVLLEIIKNLRKISPYAR